MRSFIASILLTAMLLTGCIHQAAPAYPGAQGLEQSVFPVYVNHQGGFEFDGPHSRIVTPYNVCTAVYVAPHLLATIASPFETEDTDAPVQADQVMLRDGDRSRRVEEIVFVDHALGLTLLRTDEPGTPVSIRTEPIADGEALKEIGHAFVPSVRQEFVMQPSWETRTLTVMMPPLPSGGTYYGSDDISPAAAPPCGFPVFDSHQRLVGIVRWKYGQIVAVIGTDTITDALRGLPTAQ